jgi:hypothetical protein
VRKTQAGRCDLVQAGDLLRGQAEIQHAKVIAQVDQAARPQDGDNRTQLMATCAGE